MIFQFYLMKEFVRFTAIIISFFSLMYCLIDFLERNARYFPKYGTSGAIILEYYLVQMPKMFVDLLPFAVLFAAIITLWIFSRSGEIAAARAAGASILGVSSPLFIGGGLLALVSFVLSEWVVPVAQNRLRTIESVKIEKSKMSRMFFDSNWIRSGSALLHFRSYDRVRGQLREPVFYQLASQSELSQVVRSQRAVFDASSESWVLENAVVTAFESKLPESLKVSFVPRLDTGLKAEPPRMISSGIQPTEFGFIELRRLIQESENAGISAQKRLVDLYQKLTLPLANFLFIFLALPFAVRHERQSETYTGIIISLLFAMIFWVGNFSLRSLAQTEVVSAFFAAILMPICLLAFGLFQIRRLNRSI